MPFHDRAIAAQVAVRLGVPVSEDLLDARTIRFAEGSAALEPASDAVLDEVAAALRPCRGSIVAVIGHTDAGGDARANLSRFRSTAPARCARR